MLYTVAAYAVLAALTLATGYYYNPDLFKGLLPQQPTQAEPELRPARKQKTKRAKLEDDKGTSTPASGNEKPSKKRKIISAPTNEKVTAITATGQRADLPRDDDGDMSNRDFAQQLAKAQAGTKLEKTQAPSNKDRRANGAPKSPRAMESPSLSAHTSSTGDQDPDDGTPPSVIAPASTPSTAQTSRAGDVSDMLEPAAARPTTLRLTDVAPAQPRQAPKQFEQVLTKKQRQRQAKNEENRVLREEADRAHEAKKQQQLRSARTAAGTSNQTKANTFTTSSQNAWQKKPEVQPDAQPPRSQPQQLLDTFEPETPKANGGVRAAPLQNITNGATQNVNVNAVRQEVGEHTTDAMGASGREGRPELSRETSWADEVNEDAQDEWAKSLVQNESWEPVASKKSKKKGKKDTDTSSEASAAATRPQPVANGVQKPSAARPESMNRFASMDKLNGDTWEA